MTPPQLYDVQLAHMKVQIYAHNPQHAITSVRELLGKDTRILSVLRSPEWQ